MELVESEREQEHGIGERRQWSDELGAFGVSVSRLTVAGS
jgi:hypothetical protein